MDMSDPQFLECPVADLVLAVHAKQLVARDAEQPCSRRPAPVAKAATSEQRLGKRFGSEVGSDMWVAGPATEVGEDRAEVTVVELPKRLRVVDTCSEEVLVSGFFHALVPRHTLMRPVLVANAMNCYTNLQAGGSTLTRLLAFQFVS